jgi:two-component system chemotaxis response regulator CheV
MLDVEKIVADLAPTSAIEDFEVETKMFTNKPIAVTAEDSAIIRKMITDRLTTAGFEIQSYKDGLACWNALEEIASKVEKGKRLNSLCNIVISDIEMPEMDGYTLTKNIKTHPILKKIPVILFSSLITSDLYHKGQAVGADAQMTKPQIGELLEVVRALIGDTNSKNN